VVLVVVDVLHTLGTMMNVARTQALPEIANVVAVVITGIATEKIAWGLLLHMAGTKRGEIMYA